MSEIQRPKESWGTRVGVILAVTGSAVGLGNFLRFPGLLAEYGGTFMIPYIIAFLILGLPIAFSEWALGRYGGRYGYNSTPGVFRAVGRRSHLASYVATLGPVIPILIYTFYVFIEAWCLGYAYKYATGTMPEPENIKDFFAAFTGASQNGILFENPLSNALIFLGICFILNFFLIYRGLSKGIELFCKIAMPTLILCAIIILIRVLTLGSNPEFPDRSLLDGLGYMWNPKWDLLMSGDIWLDAAGQIFFSLSVGFGIIITYASYLKPNDDISLSAITAAAGNGFTEVVLGGMIVVPAAIYFLGPETMSDPAVNGSSFNLGFVALPAVFDAMPFGNFFGFLFFFLLFLAAATSSISMLQPAIAFLEEALGLGRRASCAILGFITISGTFIVVYFTQDFAALATLDTWIATVGIYILATIQVLMFGFIMGIRKGQEEIDRGAEIRVPRIIPYVVTIICPVYLIGVFTYWVITNLILDKTITDQIQNSLPVQITLGMIILTIVFIILVISEAVRRWDRRDKSMKGAEL
ncbi:Sodium:neurotransmitter symporter family protein [Poriferisphaera corsica]|uniref:Sodium:neurotransmitter symporter family protein n=1 Tax=Poriferisphaera corsica TaxID=2528020 RepID=A0A517YSK0_9BACT|nr:sodium-dependent transporter [Poriferisphaera corsica]QDU33217.1 Sodium:neurotransmitter symporter family protein [Poriferisphaera corsica]